MRIWPGRAPVRSRQHVEVPGRPGRRPRPANQPSVGLIGGPSSKARTELAEAVVHDALAACATRESQLGGEVAAELRTD